MVDANADADADADANLEIDAAVSPLHRVDLSAGTGHVCMLLEAGAVRCWGANHLGQLGYGNLNTLGDNESAAQIGNVDVGGTAVAIAAGGTHTCALLSTGAVRCWGSGYGGRLGFGNILDVGDNETPASIGDVNIGGTAVQIETGSNHTCALLSTGKVRCWGMSGYGQLGYGNELSVGDDERPADVGDVNLGAFATQITAGSGHTCALLATGNVRCWGSGRYGQLGYGNELDIGDDASSTSGMTRYPPPPVT